MTIHQNKKTPETQNKTQNERTERHCDDRSLIFLRSRNGGFLLPSSSIGPQSTCRSRNERIVFFVAKSTGNSSDGRFAFCLQRCPVSWSSRTFKTPFSSHFFTELIIVFYNFNISIFNIYNFTYFFRPPNLHVSSFLQDLGRHSVVHFHRVCHTIYDLLRPMSQWPEDRKDSTDTTDIWQIHLSSGFFRSIDGMTRNGDDFGSQKWHFSKIWHF